MGVLALSGAVRDEVVAELATHLEELYQACRAVAPANRRLSRLL
jgi:hypothetical protein